MSQMTLDEFMARGAGKQRPGQPPLAPPAPDITLDEFMSRGAPADDGGGFLDGAADALADMPDSIAKGYGTWLAAKTEIPGIALEAAEDALSWKPPKPKHKFSAYSRESFKEFGYEPTGVNEWGESDLDSYAKTLPSYKMQRQIQGPDAVRGPRGFIPHGSDFETGPNGKPRFRFSNRFSDKEAAGRRKPWVVRADTEGGKVKREMDELGTGRPDISLSSEIEGLAARYDELRENADLQEAVRSPERVMAAHEADKVGEELRGKLAAYKVRQKQIDDDRKAMLADNKSALDIMSRERLKNDDRGVIDTTARSFGQGLYEGTVGAGEQALRLGAALFGGNDALEARAKERQFTEAADQADIALIGERSGFPTINKYAQMASRAIGQMMPAFIAGGAGARAAMAVGGDAMAASAAATRSSSLVLGGQSFLQGADLAKTRGWSNGAAALYGAANAALELYTERLGGAVGRKLGVDTAEEAVATALRAATTKASKDIINRSATRKFFTKLAKMTVGSGIEGGEELLSSIGQTAVEYALTTDPSSFSTDGFMDSFVVGSLVGGVMNGVPEIVDIVAGYREGKDQRRAAELLGISTAMMKRAVARANEILMASIDSETQGTEAHGSADDQVAEPDLAGEQVPAQEVQPERTEVQEQVSAPQDLGVQQNPAEIQPPQESQPAPQEQVSVPTEADQDPEPAAAEPSGWSPTRVLRSYVTSDGFRVELVSTPDNRESVRYYDNETGQLISETEPGYTSDAVDAYDKRVDNDQRARAAKNPEPPGDSLVGANAFGTSEAAEDGYNEAVRREQQLTGQQPDSKAPVVAPETAPEAPEVAPEPQKSPENSAETAPEVAPEAPPEKVNKNSTKESTKYRGRPIKKGDKMPSEGKRLIDSAILKAPRNVLDAGSDELTKYIADNYDDSSYWRYLNASGMSLAEATSRALKALSGKLSARRSAESETTTTPETTAKQTPEQPAAAPEFPPPISEPGAASSPAAPALGVEGEPSAKNESPEQETYYGRAGRKRHPSQRKAKQYISPLTWEQVKAKIKELATNAVEAELVTKIIEARAAAMGESLDEYVGRRIKDMYVAPDSEMQADIERSFKDIDTTKKILRGLYSPLADGRAIIKAYTGRRFNTLIHELAHMFRRDLLGDDLRIAEEWAGVKDGKWDRDAEEKFARSFERYLREGIAPTPAMRGVFNAFREWLSQIYKVIKGSQIDHEITPQMKGVFDRLVTPQEGVTLSWENDSDNTIEPAGDVWSIPVSMLSVDPERFQFKTNTSTTGVVKGQELTGEYNPIAAGALEVWEAKNGELFVIHGHHRFDLAKRNGVKRVKANIIRESDGVTALQAMILGAELNILGETGDIHDFAQFFRDSGISEEAAAKRGLLGRVKGITGFMVGKFASDDLWSLFRARKISADRAAAIADAAREDEGLQALGMAKAKSLDADALKTMLTALKMFPRDPKSKAAQGDLFGFDESAIIEAEKMGKALSEIVGGLNEKVLAVRGAIKRPEQAKKMGMTGDIKSVQKKVDKIADELDEWSRWTTNPELVRKIRKKAGLPAEIESEPTQAAEPEQAPEQTPKPTKKPKAAKAPKKAANAKVQEQVQAEPTGDDFALENKPPAPKPQEFSDDAGRQSTFITGIGSDLPGQNTLFDPDGMPDQDSGDGQALFDAGPDERFDQELDDPANVKLERPAALSRQRGRALARMTAREFRRQLRESALNDKEAAVLYAVVAAHANALGETVGEYVGRRIASLGKVRLSDDLSDKERSLLQRLGLKDGLFQRVWHGSPRSPFEKFLMEFINTGVGAQGWGWGLYFSAMRDIAEFYRRSMAKLPDEVANLWKLDGKDIPPGRLRDALNEAKELSPSESVKTLKLWRQEFLTNAERSRSRNDLKAYKRYLDKAARLEAYIDEIGYVSDRLAVEVPGTTYQVDINVNDDNLLHWDKPLSEQSKAVQEAIGYDPEKSALLDAVVGEFRDAFWSLAAMKRGDDGYAELSKKKAALVRKIQSLGAEVDDSEVFRYDERGGDFYDHLANKMYDANANKYNRDGDPAQRAASLHLLSKGVKGIKYKADPLKSDADAEYNYVVFDEADVAIEAVFKQQAAELKGLIGFAKEDGRAVIRAFEKSQDLSTLLHELAHLFRRDLSGGDLRIAEDWAGVKDGKWTEAAEEKFARGFERYMRDGKAPTPALKRIFATFKRWLSNVYRTLAGSDIDVDISDAMRLVYDRMFVAPGSGQLSPKSQDALEKAAAKTSRELDDEPTYAESVLADNDNLGDAGEPDEEFALADEGDEEEGDDDQEDAPPTRAARNESANKGREMVGLAELLRELLPGASRPWSVVLAAARKAGIPDKAAGIAESLILNPRQMTDDEVAGSVLRLRALENAFTSFQKEILETEDDSQVAAISSAMELIQGEYDKITTGLRIAGTLTGRALAIRRLELKEDFSIGAILRRAKAANGSEELTPATKRKLERMAKTIESLQEQLREARRKAIDNAADEAGEALDKLEYERKKLERDIENDKLPDNINRLAQKFAKLFISQGIKGRNRIVAMVLRELKGAYPWITRRNIIEAISDYGVYYSLSRGEDIERYRAIRGELRQIAKLKDMRDKKAPKATGREYPEPEQDERELIRKVNEKKKEGGFIDDSEGRKLSTVIGSIRTRLANEIVDLQKQIDAGKQSIKTKLAIPQDDAIDALRAQRDELKRQYNEMFGKKEMTEEQRLDIIEKTLKSSLAKYSQRIFNNDYSEDGPRYNRPEPERLAQLRAMRDKLREAYRANDPRKDSRKMTAAINAIRTRLTNDIADLQKQIDAGKQTTKDKLELPQDAEIDALRARRDEIKQQYDEMFGKKELTEEQRLAIIEKSLKTSIANYTQRVLDKDYTPNDKRYNQPETEKLAQLRRIRDRLREYYRQNDPGPIAKKMARLAELDAYLAAGILPEKETKNAPPRSPELQAAIDSLKAARLAIAQSDPAVMSRKLRTLERLKERIANGVTIPESSRRIPTTEAEERLDMEIAKAKKVIAQEIRDLKDDSWWRLLRKPMDESRTLRTSIDLSAPFRQGAFLFAGNPIKGAIAFRAMLKAAKSEAEAIKILEKIQARKNAPLYRTARLFLAELDGTLSSSEQAYMGASWAKLIPGVKASERAYVVFLNQLRADVFDSMIASLGDGNVTMKRARAIATFVNVATGRADFGDGERGMKLDAAMQELGALFFSPRYFASRVQLVTGVLAPGMLGSTRGADATIARMIAIQYAKTLVGYSIVLGLAVLAGAKVELDKESSDYMKIRVGRTRIDLLGGLSQLLTFSSRIATGKTKHPVEGYKKTDKQDVLQQFIRSKLAPSTGLFYDLVFAGKHYGNRKITKWSIIENTVVPMAASDIYEAIQANGALKGSALGVLSILGAGVNTYDKRKTF